MGRPPKPLEQKRKTGNPGKRALPATTVVLRPANDLDLEPPAHLGPAGRYLWEKAWGNGITWLSPESDLMLVVMACELADARDKTRERHAVTGDLKDLTALVKVTEQLVKMLSLMGFTPADRSRMGLAEVKAATMLQQIRAGR